MGWLLPLVAGKQQEHEGGVPPEAADEGPEGLVPLHG